MKLEQIFEAEKKIHAWFEQAKGPEDLSGVRLAYIEPLEDWYRDVMPRAKKDPERMKRLERSKQEYERRGQKFFTPDLGWWQSEEHYHDGKSGFGGATKEYIEKRNPGLVIHKTKREAIQAAGLD